MVRRTWPPKLRFLDGGGFRLTMNQIDAASYGVSAHGIMPDDYEEPPSPERRHPQWRDVPLDLWEDWRWQMQNAVRTTSQVVELLPHTPEEIAALEKLETQYKLAIP